MALSGSRDRWLTWAVRIVAVLVVCALAFFAYEVFQDRRQAQETSVTARAIASLEQAVKEKHL